ncbi:phosphate ABC transporter substrate-binding protein, partial [Actinomyces oris]
MLLTRRGALGALSVATLTALTACGRDAGAPDPNASSDLVGEIRGAGATSQSDAQDAWMNTFMGANLRATVDYAGGGSGAGRTKLVEGAIDFAGTDTPMTVDEISRIGGAVELPLYISPIAVAYNLPGFTGESHVNMTGEVLAKVLSGAITRWNDPALAALNPGAALPD